MKYLCPIDLSNCSTNSIKWILAYSKNIPEVELNLLYCIDDKGTGSQKIIEYKKEKAINLLNTMLREVRDKYPKVKIDYNIALAHPKNFIIETANQIKPDYIIMGSTGLSNIKEITIGSTTEYVVDHCEYPVLCIPQNALFTNLNAIALGVDNKEIKHPKTIKNLKKFIAPYDSKLFLIQIESSLKELELVFDQRIEEYIDDLDIEAVKLENNINVSHTINEFASINDIKLICFIHRKKNWFRNMFQTSTIKRGLFNLEFPFLVIPE